MKITVIGCGRWGSFLAWYCSSLGYDVTLYGRRESEDFKTLEQFRANKYLALGDFVRLSCELPDSIHTADAVIIAVGSQSLRGLCADLRADGIPLDKPLILCMKGLEAGSGLRLTEIVAETLGEGCRTAIWVGPGHVQEFVAGVPNCMVIDSADRGLTGRLVTMFSSGLIRFYYGDDLIGNEIGAASKNVIGLAAGMLDGLGMTSLKGALISRGSREISRLITVMGGNGMSAYGLAHLGDYEATVFSPHSHNRMCGEKFVRGESYDLLAEGIYTAEAITRLAREYGVELPICEAVYSTLIGRSDPKEAVVGLFMRSLKQEF